MLTKFKSLLQSQIAKLPIIDTEETSKSEGLIFMEFPGFPQIELSILLNPHGTLNGLQLSILLTEEDTDAEEEFLNALESDILSIASILRDYLYSSYSETTNNDACSFQLTWDTNHANQPKSEGLWLLTIEITDYLS